MAQKLHDPDPKRLLLDAPAVLPRGVTTQDLHDLQRRLQGYQLQSFARDVLEMLDDVEAPHPGALSFTLSNDLDDPGHFFYEGAAGLDEDYGLELCGDALTGDEDAQEAYRRAASARLETFGEQMTELTRGLPQTLDFCRQWVRRLNEVDWSFEHRSSALVATMKVFGLNGAAFVAEAEHDVLARRTASATTERPKRRL